jgi:hypothetical protein
LPRTNADKQACIAIVLANWPKSSDTAIGKMCGVHNETVAAYRAKHVTDSVTSQTRTDTLGREQPAHKGKTAYTDAMSVNPCSKCGHEKVKHINGGECKMILGSGSECACMEYAGNRATVTSCRPFCFRRQARFPTCYGKAGLR